MTGKPLHSSDCLENTIARNEAYPTTSATPANSLSVINWGLQWFNVDHDNSVAAPTLFLHPWFGCADMWHPVAARLQRPGLALDWYSLGEATKWQPWASPTGLLDALVLLLRRLKYRQVDVVGNSVGGIVAQLLAIRHPQLVRHVVLIGTGASLSDRPTEFGALVSRWIADPAQREELTPQLVDALTYQPLEPELRQIIIQRVDRANPEFISEVLQQARELDLRPELGNITAPTLVIRGEHDTARTSEHAAELLEGIPTAQAVELSGCGHSPMVEEPDRVAELIATHCGRA